MKGCTVTEKSSVTSHHFQFSGERNEGKKYQHFFPNTNQVNIYQGWEEMCLNREKLWLLCSDLLISALVRHVLQNKGQPVPACFENETVATRGDSCSIDLTLFIEGGLPECTYNTLTQTHKWHWSAMSGNIFCALLSGSLTVAVRAEESVTH